MKSQWDESTQSLKSGGTTKTVFDGLPLPKGKKLPDISNADLANVLIDSGVPGVSHANPRTQNLEAYSTFLGKLKTDAANAAVDAWVKSKS